MLCRSVSQTYPLRCSTGGPDLVPFTGFEGAASGALEGGLEDESSYGAFEVNTRLGCQKCMCLPVLLFMHQMH